jgi:hypothetical protein
MGLSEGIQRNAQNKTARVHAQQLQKRTNKVST